MNDSLDWSGGTGGGERDDGVEGGGGVAIGTSPPETSSSYWPFITERTLIES